MEPMKISSIFSQNEYPIFAEKKPLQLDRQVHSVYMSSAQKVQPQLDQISSSLCLAKWLQVSLQLTTGQTQSCYHPPTHKIPINEIQKDVSALHNTQYKKEQRKKMLQGERPAECSTCWKMEDLGHLSDRHYRSAEEWSWPRFHEVLASGAEKNILPSYVEVNFNHACQLKCSYCSPHISSSWMEEIKQFGPYPTINPHNSLEWFEKQELIPHLQSDKNPYAEAFWRWWPELYKTLRVFRMTGGEPLMDINTYKVLDYILKNPKPDLKLSITSNFSIQAELFHKFISRVQKISDGHFAERVTVFVSCDSVGDQAEYIRHGLDFEYMLNNVDHFLTTVQTGVVSFILTMTNLNIFGFQNLLEKILYLRRKHSRYFQRVWFDTPPLRFPSWQSLQILPEENQKFISTTIDWMKTKPMTMQTTQSRLHGFHDYEVARLQRVLDWMKSGLPDAESLKLEKINFYRFFSEHDRRRNTKFLTVFPELQSFWKSCEQLSHAYDASKVELKK